MRIIPAIDIIDGQCVRLTQGDYDRKKVYNSDPLEVAKMFADHGITYLHLVDLDGAKAGTVQNLSVLEKIATHTSLIIDFGGGLRTTEDVQRVFDAGAKQITGGSVAVKNPDLFEEWIATFGGEKIILGADALNNQIAISGWTEATELPVGDFIKGYQKKGIAYVICTDISRDGALTGPAKDLYEDIRLDNPTIKLIASGGISGIVDVEMMQAIGMEGVIIGKAIYEKRISLKELAPYVN
jgi:phosphoribosylformimino-5-aminoimidazole carboxamide ribotide isomerase